MRGGGIVWNFLRIRMDFRQNSKGSAAQSLSHLR